MWVRRNEMRIKPGVMAEAVAHIKALQLQEGTTLRMLRPVNGPVSGRILVCESFVEDPDAAMEGFGRPKPAGEWAKRMLEFTEALGNWDLYRVVFEADTQDRPGAWLQRRVRWMNPGKRGEWVAALRDAPLWTGLATRSGCCFLARARRPAPSLSTR